MYITTSRAGTNLMQTSDSLSPKLPILMGILGGHVIALISILSFLIFGGR